MRYFSLFTGVGGFEMGIQNAYVPRDTYEQERPPLDASDKPCATVGGERDVPICVGMSEIDRFASDVLRYHYPETTNYGDIALIDWSKVPDFDLLVGGSPCQSFSIAGKRAGFSGASGLYFEYLRCLKEKKPEHFIWENVKGVLSSNGGRDFAVILDTMAEAGYSLWWSVLNAKDFGVPQNRERVFIVGSRTGSPREVLFEPANARPDNEVDGRETQIAGTLNSCMSKGGNRHDARSNLMVRETEVSTALDANYAKGADNHGQRTFIIEKNGLDTLTPPGTSDAFRVYGTDGEKVEGRIRKLMPCECEALMSWPKDHTRYGRKPDGTIYEISDSQRYKMCGNGVVSKVVAEIVKAHLL